MRKTLLTLALVALAILALTAPVVAADGDKISDASGDVEGEPVGGASSADIVKAANGHAKGGDLWHAVTVKGTAADPAKGGLVPYLYIEVPNRANGTSECAYFVGRHRGKLGVFTCGYADRIAKARIVRTSAHTIKYTFNRDAIGNPSWYDWAFAVIGGSDGTAVQHDRSPSQDDVYVRHTVR
jgi:hypothetical protein